MFLINSPKKNKIGWRKFMPKNKILNTKIDQEKADVKNLRKQLRESEQKVLQLEKQYRDIVDNANEGVCVVDYKEIIIYVNKMMIRMLGYNETELIGKPFRTFLSKESKKTASKKLIERHKGVSDRYEIEFVGKGGKKIHTIVSASPVADGKKKVVGGMGLFLDITEQKKAEEACSRLASFPEYNPSPVIEADLTGHVHYLNPAARQLMPDLEQKGFGHPWLSAWEGMIRGFRKGQSNSNTREVIVGNKFYQQVIHYVSEIDRVRIYGMDITERRRNEETLSKLNRTLKALSDSSQTLIGATDEAQYLQEVCQIIVEDCGHAMVWIGYAENDREKTARPIASAGFEQGYLDKLNITWSDKERGRGPTGTAIRTGKPSFCRSMLTDQKFEPWRKEAIKRGYASSAVFLLKDADRTFGAINIYSKEPDAFSEDEVKLLAELADDISYGITVIRARTARDEAERKLRDTSQNLLQTRDYLDNLFNYANAPIITWDPKYRITRFNHAFERLTQRKGKEVLGEKLNILFPSKSKRKSLEHIRQASAGKNWESVEIPILRKDGITRIVLWNSATLYTPDGKKPIATIAQGQDITEIKKTEESLKKAHDELDKKVQERTRELRKTNKSLEREIEMRIKIENNLAEAKKNLDTIFESTQEGLALYDKEGRTVQINPALNKLFGVKRGIVGVNREEIAKNREKYFGYYMERYDDSIKTQKTVYSGKPVSNVMIKVHSTPPRYLEANYVPVKGAKGKVIGMIGSFRDVTVMKNQEVKITKQLLEAEKQKDRWQAIFENVEEGIFIIDPNLRIVQANDKSELMSGYFEKEMLGKPYYEVFGCHDRRGAHYPEFKPVTKALATGEAIPYEEHLHTCKDGREIWVGVSYTPIFDDKGDVDQLVGVIRDITAIKELERAKSEFVSLASHELRTPLTVINGYLSLLLSGDIGKIDGEVDSKSFMAATKKIYGETNRLTKLVEDLLNVSRIEEGRLKINLRKIQFTETVSEVINDFKPIAEQKNIKLNLRNKFDGRENLVLVDRDKIKQVLVNLIDNSIKYTNEGGSIKVECFAKDGEIITQVSDTGIGIKPEMLPRIFEKFQQATGSYLKDNKGSGLGLFIVKSLIELQKGKVWAESDLNKGSKFTFTLPLVADN
jgi:PAS domain S-box-containing protein